MKETSLLATLGGAVALLVSSAASASSVTPFTQMFSPTSADVQQLAMDFGATYTYAIFDSTDLGSLSNPLIMDQAASSNGQDTILVTGSAGSLTLTSNDNPSETLSLSSADTFFFAISTDGGSSFSPWLYGLEEGSLNQWNFDFQANGTGALDLIMSDIAPVGPPQEIPVPAAVWLFGSGLLGMFGVARRKK